MGDIVWANFHPELCWGDKRAIVHSHGFNRTLSSPEGIALSKELAEHHREMMYHPIEFLPRFQDCCFLDLHDKMIRSPKQHHGGWMTEALPEISVFQGRNTGGN